MNFQAALISVLADADTNRVAEVYGSDLRGLYVITSDGQIAKKDRED